VSLELNVVDNGEKHGSDEASQLLFCNLPCSSATSATMATSQARHNGSCPLWLEQILACATESCKKSLRWNIISSVYILNSIGRSRLQPNMNL